MRQPHRPGRWPYILSIEVRWPDGVTTRDEVARYADEVKARREAVRARRAWSALLGAWHWPPMYSVTDQRTGRTWRPGNPTEGSGNHATQASTGGDGSLF